MGKMASCLAVFCLVLLSTMSAHSQNEESRDLVCRGRLGYIVYQEDKTSILFKKNRTVAGRGGRNLLPGTCAFMDRCLTPGQPTTLESKPDTSEKVLPTFVAFTACAGDSNCVFSQRVSFSNATLKADEGFVRIHYPLSFDLLPIATVEVVPSATGVHPGRTVQLSAIARDSGGNRFCLHQGKITWSTSDDSLATVSTSGLVTTEASVSHVVVTITATIGGISATAEIAIITV